MTLPLEQQVVSLELAKQMKELGFEQESLFYWYKTPDTRQWAVMKEWEGSFCVNDYDGKIYSAPTVAELGEMLPKEIVTSYGTFRFIVIEADAFEQMWTVNYMTKDYEVLKKEDSTMDVSEANARAKMLIHLKKGKLI